MNHQPVERAENPTAILDRAAFDIAITTVLHAVERRATIPILSNVLLSAEAGALRLRACDLDMEIRVRLAGDVDDRMWATLPAHLLKGMCSNAPKSDRFTIAMLPAEGRDDGEGSNQFASDRCEVSFGKTRYTLNSLPAADFPDLPDMDGTAWKFSLPGSVLWNAIDSVRLAISTEETRYYLNGIFLFRPPASDALRAVATDGHRLYCQEMAAPKGSDNMPGIIIPRSACEVLHKLLKGKACPAEVKIKLTDQQLMVSWGEFDFRTKLIDGVFPDYLRVVPTGNSMTAEFLSRHLQDGIKAVTVMSDDRGRAVRMSLDRAGATLKVVNPDAGVAVSNIRCDYDGQSMEIGFNAGYLASMVADACPGGGYITMKVETASSPVLVIGSHRGWYGVLMPTRV